MQGSNRFLDDMSKLMTNAMGVAQGAKDEAETAMKGWIDRWLADRDFVTREEFDAVMVLQPTSPLRMVSDINACLKMLSESSADSVISVVNVGGHHPARMKFIESGFLIDPPFAEEIENQPRQNLRSMYIRNGAIYLTRVSVLKSRSFQGKNCLAYEMPSERSVNIDTFMDLKIAEFFGLLQ